MGKKRPNGCAPFVDVTKDNAMGYHCVAEKRPRSMDCRHCEHTSTGSLCKHRVHSALAEIKGMKALCFSLKAQQDVIKSKLDSSRSLADIMIKTVRKQIEQQADKEWARLFGE